MTDKVPLHPPAFDAHFRAWCDAMHGKNRDNCQSKLTNLFRWVAERYERPEGGCWYGDFAMLAFPGVALAYITDKRCGVAPGGQWRAFASARGGVAIIRDYVATLDPIASASLDASFVEALTIAQSDYDNPNR